jgi:hypothetical protein
MGDEKLPQKPSRTTRNKDHEPGNTGASPKSRGDMVIVISQQRHSPRARQFTSFVLPTTSILTSTQRNIESFQIISLVPILEPSQDASFISSST